MAIPRGSASPLDVQLISPSACAAPPCSPAAPAALRVVFVPGAAGQNDHGPNALALAGLKSEAAAVGLPAAAVTSSGNATDRPLVLDEVANRADVIVGLGAEWTPAFLVAARARPGAAPGRGQGPRAGRRPGLQHGADPHRPHPDLGP